MNLQQSYMILHGTIKVRGKKREGEERSEKEREEEERGREERGFLTQTWWTKRQEGGEEGEGYGLRPQRMRARVFRNSKRPLVGWTERGWSGQGARKSIWPEAVKGRKRSEGL